MTRMSVPFIGGSPPILGFLQVLIACLMSFTASAFDEPPLWPGKTVTWSDGSVHEWPLFVPGHEMDYLTNVWWAERRPTWETTECGMMQFTTDGRIIFSAYKKKHKVRYLNSHMVVECDRLYRYKKIKITDEYISLLINLHPFNKKPFKNQTNFEIWVLSRFDAYFLFKLNCGQGFIPEFEKKARSLNQDELLDVWGKQERCNPDLMPPDRDYFWMNHYYDANYTIVKHDQNPHWSQDGFRD